MTVNSERTKIYTDYCRSHDNEYPLLKRSGALLEWAKTREGDADPAFSSPQIRAGG